MEPDSDPVPIRLGPPQSESESPWLCDWPGPSRSNCDSDRVGRSNWHAASRELAQAQSQWQQAPNGRRRAGAAVGPCAAVATRELRLLLPAWVAGTQVEPGADAECVALRFESMGVFR